MIIKTIKESYKPNQEIVLKLNKKAIFNKIRIATNSYYSIYIKNRLVDFGPVRAAKGHYYIKETNVNKSDDLLIRVIIYKIPTFEFALEDFYLGIELCNNNKLVATTNSFRAYTSLYHINESIKYTPQRGFVERYNLLNSQFKELTLTNYSKKLNEISLIKNKNKYPLYKSYREIVNARFKGFSKKNALNWLNNPRFIAYKNININDMFFKKIKGKYFYKIIKLNDLKTGLVNLNIKSNKEQTVFVLLNEHIEKGSSWYFGRDNGVDLIEINLKKGVNEIKSNVPYSFKYVMIIYKYPIDYDFSISLIENEIKMDKRYITNDKKINKIIDACLNSFKQNTYDIMTDCPSRERAGWLCDTYFTSIAERFFLGSNEIEKRTLLNFVYADSKEIDSNMIPMCYPGSFISDCTYIPQWALWFVIEINKYTKVNKDTSLKELAKNKIYKLIKFFNKYETKEGLLANLPSWSFIEWSDINSLGYMKGVNFSSNILYYAFLTSISELYHDEMIARKADTLKDNINKYSFNGTLYVENAVIKNNKIIPFKDHISETAQYLAYYFNINRSKSFINTILKLDKVNNIVKSAPFIGQCLKLLTYYDLKQYKYIIKYTINYFLPMANATNTLWEKNDIKGSLNHGFASCIAPIIYNSYKKGCR